MTNRETRAGDGTDLCQDALEIAGHAFAPACWWAPAGTATSIHTRAAIEASGARIVTVAIRRSNTGQDRGQPNLLDILPPSRHTILPSMVGCYTAADAVRYGNSRDGARGRGDVFWGMFF